MHENINKNCLFFKESALVCDVNLAKLCEDKCGKRGKQKFVRKQAQIFALFASYGLKIQIITQNKHDS